MSMLLLAVTLDQDELEVGRVQYYDCLGSMFNKMLHLQMKVEILQ